MLQPIKALTWEYLCEIGWLWLGILGMVILGPMAFGMLIGIYGADGLHTGEEPMKMYVNFLGIAALAYLTPPLYGMTTTAPRNRGLPISTPLWAGVMFVLSISVVMLSNVLTQLVYFWHANTQWPILTTTVSLGAFASLAIAGGWWLRDFRGYKLLVGPAILTAWTYWLLRHFLDARLRGPIQMWETLSATDVLIFAGTVVASWFLTLRACSRYRCGEADGGWMFRHFLSPQSSLLQITGDLRICNTNLETPINAKTPAQALSTMNRESSRIYLILGNVFIPAVLILMGLLTFRDRGNPLKGCSVMMLMFSGVAGMLAGQDIWMRKTGGMRPFLSTLPISDKDYASTMLRSSVRASLITWAAVLLGSAILLALYFARYDMDRFRSHYNQVWLIRTFGHWGIAWHLVGTALTCWVCAGGMRAISSTGRMMTMVWAIVITEGSVVLVMILTGLGDDGAEWAQQLGEGVALGIGLFFGVLVPLYLFGRALRRGLVTTAETFWCGVTAATLCAVLLTFLPGPTLWKCVACCVACLVVAPVAAIPCAVQWNRHR